MTRETKIGLLVGLSFIIVIGILLSDHLTTRGELPAAQLSQVGDAVRSASAVPAPTNPPLTPVTVPTNITPTNTVLTHDELNSKPATAIVQVGPSRNSTPVSTTPTGVVVNVGPATTVSDSTPAVTTTPIKDDHIGQTLAAVSDAKTSTGNPADDMKPVSGNQTLALANNPTLKSIKAEKGDSVSKLAVKYLGSNTSSNRQAIIDANPALKSDPAKIVIGRTYMIPTKPASTDTKPTAVASADTTSVINDVANPTSDSATPTDTKPDTKTSDKPKKSDKSTKTTNTSTYTVKSNDTLWKIANGDPAVLKEIQDLNKDVLKGKSTVHPGITLKIPAKTAVASR